MNNPKVRRSLKMWVIERTPKGKPAQRATLQLVSTSHGYRCRDPAVYRVLNDFVASLDIGATVDACIEAALVSLGTKRTLAPLKCPSCAASLLD